MSTKELTARIAELQEWERLAEEAESIKDELKQLMVAQNTEEMEVGEHIIRYTSVLSNRFDTTNFKKAYGEIYKRFTKQVASRRFSIA